LPTRSSLSLFFRLVVVVAVLPTVLTACGGGDGSNDIVVPLFKASFVQTPPTQTDRVVFMDNVTATGDILNMDVMVQDTSGTLDLDDIDLVLRYDASFLQVTSIRRETLLGDCGTVNPACQLVSPICIDNHSAANAGGERFCRIDGSTPCAKDSDCPAIGDACGSFGGLETSFAVITGPKTCSNNSAISCSSSLDCRFCTLNTSLPCTSAAECASTCSAGTCLSGSFAGQSCSRTEDCIDTCGSGLCSGCPSVVVNGAKRIVNLTFRVIQAGSSDLRFVISSNPLDTASFLRKGTVDVSGVQFWPNIDAGNPSLVQGSFIVIGTK
jgi:hypothetical protein